MEPSKKRTCPERTLENNLAFCTSVLASWINAISSSGIPFFISFSFKASYTLKVPSFFGVEESQNTNCAAFCPFVSSQIVKHRSAQAETLLFFVSGSISLRSLWSKASLRPSVVIFNMLSSLGSTTPFRTNSARSARDCRISFCSSLAGRTIFSYSASGTGSFNISAVCISATS